MELYWAHKVDDAFAYLDQEETHHCIKVMRNQPGNEVEVTDGLGNKYAAMIADYNKKECRLQLISRLSGMTQKRAHCHIAMAPTKNISRFEWFLEKATELGVDEITPLICSRSERVQLKLPRLQKQVIAAMKQSLRTRLPALHEPCKFSDFISKYQRPDSNTTDQQGLCKIICYCGEHDLPKLRELCKPDSHCVILIGPEGDFTPDEIAHALNSGFSGAGLGQARLRTETAGLVAVQTFQLINDC